MNLFSSLRQSLKTIVCVGTLFFLSEAASAQTWIWYPGDFEVWLSNKMQVRDVLNAKLYFRRFGNITVRMPWSLFKQKSIFQNQTK